MFSVSFVLLGCSSIPRPPLEQVTLKFQSSEDLNPNVNGRASPVDVHIYQLKNLHSFTQAKFFDLYTNPSETLEKDLIEEHKFEINIHQTKEFTLKIDEETQYLGFLVAYYDLENAKWRDTIATSAVRGDNIIINFNKLSFSIS